VSFLCKVDGTHEIKLSSEHQSYVWLDVKDVDQYEFWHEKIKERLKAINSNTRISRA